MATKTWVGTDVGNEGEFATAANWSASGVPANTGDTWWFTSGSQILNADLSQGAKTADAILIGPSFTGGIGNNASDPLVCGCAGVMTVKPGGGAYYINGYSVGNPIVSTLIECPSAATVVQLLGYHTTVVIRRGTVTLVSGTYGTVIIDPVTGDPANVIVIFGAATITTCVAINAGFTTTGVGPTITNYTGTGNTSVLSVGTITNPTLYDATLYHDAATNITTASLYGSIVLDATRDPRAKTFTTVKKTATASALVDNGAAGITLTNSIKDFSGQLVLSGKATDGPLA